jgi:DNA-binding beta-propeller fold protein YncE
MASVEGPIRFSSFNVSLFRDSEGQLITDLSTPDNAQAKANAEIIQRANPDVLLVNEFDFDPDGKAAALFQKNYLSISQNGADAIEYPYVYVAPSNTGISSGFDLNNDGDTVTTPGDRAYGDDSLGFGVFPGQYAMVLYSKYPIVEADVRTFQKFLWKDMPGALLPDNPETQQPKDWYSQEELEVFRLSSKNHWDIPIDVNGEVIHVLASHPTPPGFDGEEDRNGKRNYDEIRFWADYVTPGKGDYIYDDAGNTGGLSQESNFVVMGDQNADPFDGGSLPGAIQQLLDHPLINNQNTPASEGGPEQAVLQGKVNATHQGDPAFDTADFSDALPDSPGNLRVDYVLPSADLEITDSSVFWPKTNEPLFPLVGTFDSSLRNGFPSSDHRLVSADVKSTVSNQIALSPIGTYETGVFDQGAAEIVAHDPETQRLFVVNANSATIDILDIQDPTQPQPVNTIDVSRFGAGVNSVDIRNGVVAAAVENESTQSSGAVVFFDTEGKVLNSIPVGALPDMLTFTPDGQKVLVANEGEPSNDYTIDPKGSVSIIDLSGGVANLTQADVTTADFQAFNDQKAALQEDEVRIFGPNASVAQDVEPEYIGISADAKTAWISLQENNALGVLDIESGQITDILPLGYKDHNRSKPQLETLTSPGLIGRDGNGLDVSDSDDAINIQNWPVQGMYQPDAIASYKVNDKTFLITANEGDSRDYEAFSEEGASSGPES